jgi:hypothetical protein
MSVCDEKAIASLVSRWIVKKINILSKVSNLNTLKKSLSFFLKGASLHFGGKESLQIIFENFTV